MPAAKVHELGVELRLANERNTLAAGQRSALQAALQQAEAGRGSGRAGADGAGVPSAEAGGGVWSSLKSSLREYYDDLSSVMAAGGEGGGGGGGDGPGRGA